jgi:amino acid transporter
VLMNTTKKSFACWAVCFSIISYIATAVVSADVAITYIKELLPSIEEVWGTSVLLLIFALLNVLGLRESAGVASAIFFFHLVVMMILLIDVFVWAAQDGFSLLATNYYDRDVVEFVEGQRVNKPLMPIALLYGFSSSLLGITGFESSANFVEEQAKGVYPKTCRNMWLIVAFLNPVFSLLSLSVRPPSHLASPF